MISRGSMPRSLLIAVCLALFFLCSTKASSSCPDDLERKKQEVDDLSAALADMTAELGLCRGSPTPAPLITPVIPMTPSPTHQTTVLPATEFTCDGIVKGTACCVAACGMCGGPGCSDRGSGLTGDDCCTSNIEERGFPCSTVSGQAPCYLSEPLVPTTSTPTATPETLTPEAESPTPIDDGEDGVAGWVPKVGDSWQYNLDTPVDTDVDVDVFLIDMDYAQDTIDELHAKGKWVSCYISVGSIESWREDAGVFPSTAVGHTIGIDSGENYLDITDERVRAIMEARVQKAAGMGCDAIEPDHMSNWHEDTGFTISREDQIAYNEWFALMVRENGMLVGMKDSVELIDDLNESFDFAIAVECWLRDTCEKYVGLFLGNNKPVFNVEYSKDYGVCDGSNELRIDTIFKNYDLKVSMCSCADPSRDADCDGVTGFTDGTDDEGTVSTPAPSTREPETPAPMTPSTPAPVTPAPVTLVPTSAPVAAPVATTVPVAPTPTTPAADGVTANFVEKITGTELVTSPTLNQSWGGPVSMAEKADISDTAASIALGSTDATRAEYEFYFPALADVSEGGYAVTITAQLRLGATASSWKIDMFEFGGGETWVYVGDMDGVTSEEWNTISLPVTTSAPENFVASTGVHLIRLYTEGADGAEAVYVDQIVLTGGTSGLSVPAPVAPAPTPEPPTTPLPTAEPTPAPTSETEEIASEKEEAGSGENDGWLPKIGDTWQHNLNTPVNTDVDADVFFIDMDNAQDTIDELHGRGRWVSCYISVGTVESWREDAGDFPASAVGESKVNVEGERFLDINQNSVKDLMEARVVKAADMGCDAIEPDNMSNWNENTGFTISRDDQISYNRWFSGKVHESGMLVGMKNAFELVGDMSEDYDFAVSEECHEWDECNVYTVPFLRKDKPVFNVEYSKDYTVCTESNALGIDTIFKNFELGAPICSCADPSRDFDCDNVIGFADDTEPPAPTPTPSTPSPTPPTPPSPPSPTPAPPSPTPLITPSPTPTPLTTPPPTSTPPTPSPLTPTPPLGGGWVPRVGDTWNYNLNTPVDTDQDVDVFFIDMDGAQDTIDELHGKGKWVSCYISVGTVESWRSDAGAFPSSVVGNSWDDWAGEKFLDVSQQSVRDIMQARVETAARMNCDAIEPDNMSNWNQGGTGLTISRDEQVSYNKWFADTVHANGMLVGMKNAIELIGDTHEHYDFVLNEECHQWNECGAYDIPFLEKGKPVFNVEYDVDYNLCSEANEEGLDTIFKEYDLNAAVCSCADSSRDVDCSDVTG